MGGKRTTGRVSGRILIVERCQGSSERFPEDVCAGQDANRQTLDFAQTRARKELGYSPIRAAKAVKRGAPTSLSAVSRTV